MEKPRIFTEGCFLLILLLLAAFQSDAQTFQASTGTPAAFNNYSQVMSTLTAGEYIKIKYSFSNKKNYPNWSLKVKASGAFTNGTHSLPLQYVSIRFNKVSVGGPSGTDIGFNSTPLTLRTSEISLVTNASAPLGDPYMQTEQTFDMIIKGGNNLLLSSGIYTTNLTFNWYDKNDKLVETTNVPVSFALNYDKSCTGITLSSITGVQTSFNTIEELVAGKTNSEYITIRYNPGQASCGQWTLKVRTAGKFTNGTNQIDPQYFSVRFNRVSTGAPTASAIGINTDPVPLSTADVTLINRSQAGFTPYTFTEHKVDLIIKGGSHLIVPTAGLYTTTLVFSLYNESNQLVSTTNIPATFQISSQINTGYTIQLQNSADLISLALGSPSDLINGASVTKLNGLKVTGYKPYQVIVKSTHSDLVSGTSPSAIPVSVIKLQASAASNAGGIMCTTRDLSASDQTIIWNPVTDSSYQTTQYHLKYYTSPSDKRLISVPAATYTTNVVFVVIPQ